MKKLLVLMLVLGLASAANAVLSLSVNGGAAPSDITIAVSDTLVIDVTSSTSNAYAVLLYVFDYDNRTLSNPRTTRGDLSAVYYYGPPTYMPPTYPQYFAIAIADSGGLTPGTGFEVDYLATAAGDVLITLNDYTTGAVIESLTIHQTPEPMTIALLGLGGLFLRRRK